MIKKTPQLLAYIIKIHPQVPVTSLMKLTYLVDLVHIKKGNGQISDFKYARYKYGPFDQSIYQYLNELVLNKIITEDTNWAPSGGEYIVYQYNDEYSGEVFNSLSQEEKNTIDEVVGSLNGLGAKALVEVAYKTKPMKKLGATIGGDENLNKILDLQAT